MPAGRVDWVIPAYAVCVSLDVVPPYAKEHLTGSDIGSHVRRVHFIKMIVLVCHWLWDVVQYSLPFHPGVLPFPCPRQVSLCSPC